MAMADATTAAESARVARLKDNADIALDISLSLSTLFLPPETRLRGTGPCNPSLFHM
jgi:hypothetical protein